MPFSEIGVTGSGTVGAQFAPSNPDLALIVNQWSTLTDDTRRRIVATLQEAVDGRADITGAEQ
jgi:hypothetical protein